MLNQKQTLTALLISLSLLSSASHSRSSRHYQERSNPNEYNVELSGGLGRFETEDSTTKSSMSILGADIYFDEIDTTGKPLAYAAFLNKKTSISLFYTKADTDVEILSTTSTFEDTNTGIGFNYISEEDNYILGITYSSGDTTTDGGTTVSGDIDLAESSSIGINIGKYISDSSAIEFIYSQDTTDILATTFSTSAEITTDVATLSYENLIDLGSEKFIYISGSASSIKQDGFGVKETNQEYALTAEVFFNKNASLVASAEINTGDDLLSEGRTISGGGTYFITTKFAINAVASIFTPDDEFSQDETTAFISGILRF